MVQFKYLSMSVTKHNSTLLFLSPEQFEQTQVLEKHSPKPKHTRYVFIESHFLFILFIDWKTKHFSKFVIFFPLDIKIKQKSKRTHTHFDYCDRLATGFHGGGSGIGGIELVKSCNTVSYCLKIQMKIFGKSKWVTTEHAPTIVKNTTQPQIDKKHSDFSEIPSHSIHLQFIRIPQNDCIVHSQFRAISTRVSFNSLFFSALPFHFPQRKCNFWPFSLWNEKKKTKWKIR